jgi:2-amino-4-hydroxy-6-hydroxymethyldihydropteridine diphosphokinase
LEKAFLLAGTNMGDRKANLGFAVSCLAKGGVVRNISSCFETEPVGYLDQPWFLNQAIEMETPLSPSELLTLCQSIESACGRVRTFRNAPRTLDLDILLYGSIVVHEENLIIPHPRLVERRFALAPLAQIAPEFVHPLLNKTIQTLLEVCPDSSEVRIPPAL